MGFSKYFDIILLNYWRIIQKTHAKLHSFLFPHSYNTYLSFTGKPQSDLSTVGYTVQTSLLSGIKDVIGRGENFDFLEIYVLLENKILNKHLY